MCISGLCYANSALLSSQHGLQGRGRGRGELEREPSFSFDLNGPYSLQTRLDMEAIGDTGLQTHTSQHVFYLLPGASHMLSHCLVHCHLNAVISSCLGMVIVAQHILSANLRHQQKSLVAGEPTDSHLCGLTCAPRTSGQAHGAHGLPLSMLWYCNIRFLITADCSAHCQGLMMC